MTALYEWLSEGSAATATADHQGRQMMALYEWLSEASLWWWPRFADHLWQTTLFVLVVLVAALALRSGPARLRYNFWLIASAKFIVPAAFLVFFAQQTGIDSLPFLRSAPHMEQHAILVTGVTEPVSAIVAANYEVTVIATAPGDHKDTYFALTAIWLAGFATLVLVGAIRRHRFLRSLKLGRKLQRGREWRALARAREALQLQTKVGLVISPLKIEPAAWGIWRPVIVMPASIVSQLDDEELEAIMLHELVHIQRRDNLIGNLQLALCALLWFHPLVWFISRKLFDEREHACDERVMAVCKAPEAYAASILKVVRFSFGWRVAGVAGAASGSNLRRRIENIMTTGNSMRKPRAGSRLLAGALVATALVVLVCAGVYNEAQGIDSKSTEVSAATLESMAVNVAQVSSNTSTADSSLTLQKGKKRVMPPPPEPLQPAQPDQPDQPPQPAQAPNPSQVPQPSAAPQPAQAPQPVQAPQPAQMPPPPPPAAFGSGIGRGAASGIGSGSAGGVGRGTGSAGGSGFASGVGGGVGSGVGSTPAPASAPARIAPPPPSSVPTTPAPPARKQEQDQKSKEKVEKGQLIEAPHPVYPAAARENKIEGTVSIRITIDEEGKVISAEAQTGPEVLREASQAAAYKARFKPALKDGKPVQVKATLAYDFVISQRIKSPSR